jgi:competence protein ComEC
MTLQPELIILDVGQGNCTLLRNTEGNMLIDCPSGSILMETLEELKIQQISHLLISHADKDHVGGVSTLLRSDDISVQCVHINSELQRQGIVWDDLMSSLIYARKERGVKIIVQLTTSTTDSLNTGEVQLKILAPVPELAVKGGAGAIDQSRNLLNANSMSAVIGFYHKSHGVAIAAGDLDQIGLDNLLQEEINLKADILIFPHHGGRPGAGKKNDGIEFTKKLCDLVQPKLVIFSNGRGHYDHPFKEIVEAVISTVPNVHILCTQLSKNCSQIALTQLPNHLHSLPAKGKSNNSSCGGTVVVKINGKDTNYTPQANNHQDFITTQVSTPLCNSSLRT